MFLKNSNKRVALQIFQPETRLRASVESDGTCGLWVTQHRLARWKYEFLGTIYTTLQTWPSSLPHHLQTQAPLDVTFQQFCATCISRNTLCLLLPQCLLLVLPSAGSALHPPCSARKKKYTHLSKLSVATVISVNSSLTSPRQKLITAPPSSLPPLQSPCCIERALICPLHLTVDFEGRT